MVLSPIWNFVINLSKIIDTDFVQTCLILFSVVESMNEEL